MTTMTVDTAQLRIALRDAALTCWQAAASDPSAWHPMTAAEAEYCLNVLPPLYFKGGFAVPEAVRTGSDGRSVYLCVVHRGGQPFCREMAYTDAAFSACKLINPSADMPGVK